VVVLGVVSVGVVSVVSVVVGAGSVVVGAGADSVVVLGFSVVVGAESAAADPVGAVGCESVPLVGPPDWTPIPA
jgi:hypothetical protein